MWENSSSTTSFTAQDVDVDLSSYKLYMIIYRVVKNSSFCVDMIGTTSSSNTLYTLGMYSGKLILRSCKYSNANLTMTFGAGSLFGTYGSSSTTDNDYMIPMYIIGIK